MKTLTEQDYFAKARVARDARFDGLFFIAVKTTKIFCRPICPATSPKESNVTYYKTAIEAANAGYRPCLRCRPDSAPQSFAWQGTQTSFQRAIKLIDQGALQDQTIEQLADRLGMTSRYLRQLFVQYLGTSPKRYALYQQCLFAKQLLHESNLPITQIAFAAGFKSIRRFNDAFQQNMGLTPSQIRKKSILNDSSSLINLKLYYRPPLAWSHLQRFLKQREIAGLEWSDTNSYSRTIEFQSTRGFFTVTPVPKENYLNLKLHLNECEHLSIITKQIRQLFDLDAPINSIDQQLKKIFPKQLSYVNGLRVPGIWNLFEAGIRAILGQQVSVIAARNLVAKFVEHLGEDAQLSGPLQKKYFPKPKAVYRHPLDFFKMPQARKDTIRRLAEYFVQNNHADDIDEWINLKGIGAWTVDYVKLRGSKDPNIWLASDLGIKNALKKTGEPFDIEAAQPWCSYLTFQTWNQLST